MRQLIKVSEAEGDQLDHLVALALVWKVVVWGDTPIYVQASGEGRFRCNVKDWHPSTDWAQGGPIMEAENIGVFRSIMEKESIAIKDQFTESEIISYGPTSLIAAMRCFVAFEFQHDEVPLLS